MRIVLFLFVSCISVFMPEYTLAGVGRWTRLGPNGPGDRAGDFDIHFPSGTIYTVSGEQIHKSADSGGTWIDLTDEISFWNLGYFSIVINPLDPDIVYIGSLGEEGSMVYKTTDGGSEWTRAGEGLPVGEGSYWVEALAIDPSAPDIVYAGIPLYGMYKTTDGGEHWEPKVNGLWNPHVESIAIDPTNTNIIYVACRSYDPCYEGDVFKSTDAGESWTAMNDGLPPPAPFMEDGPPGGADEEYRYDVENIVIDPLHPQTLYVAVCSADMPFHSGKITFFSRVYKTTEGAKNWVKRSDGLPVETAHCLPYVAIDPRHSDTVYAGYAWDTGWEIEGVYRSTDGGESWAQFNEGFPEESFWIGVLRASPYDPPVVYASTSQNIWSYTYPSSVDEGPGNILPERFELCQNHSNPFNPTTEIKYTLPKEGHVRLDIYNILGRKVVTLVDARQNAGYKRVTWDATDVVSGVYFYQISAGDFTFTRKMVFLR